MKKQHTLYILGIFLFLTENTYAYLDPGTGSMLLQGLIAAIAAGLVVIKLYWQKMKAFLFGRGRKENSPAGSPADNVPEEDDPH
jgi:hypothetical protein